jgi:hypothetical protein
MESEHSTGTARRELHELIHVQLNSSEDALRFRQKRRSKNSTENR